MNQNEICLLGQTNFRNRQIRFGIKTDDRRRHVYLVGKTGMGKSNMLETMIYQDIQAGRGVSLVDPHGELAEKALSFVPTNRINDVIYFNPADTSHPIAFNVLERVDPLYRHLVSSGLIGVFKKIWADSWGPRLEYLLRNAILALLDYPDSTLLGINRMLVDKAYRKKVIEKIQDPVVKAFWVDEYSKYPDKFATEAIAPIQNKVGQFLSSSLIRNIVGQVKSTISMREVMDEGKILILNLSKGRIGEDNSALLGAMMVTKIQLAAMSRVDVPEKQRRDFYLYVDEFQNFATDSFADILSEARKYRLNLIMAHQYIEQLGEVVQPAVFGNIGTMIVFRVGATDAEFLVKELTPYFTEEDLVNLPKYQIYLKLMIDGIASNPFSAGTLPPIEVDMGNVQKIITISRERYAKPREVVEDKIRRWAGMETIKEPAGREETPYGEVAEPRKREPRLRPGPARPPLARPGPARPSLARPGPARPPLARPFPAARPPLARPFPARPPLARPGPAASVPDKVEPVKPTLRAEQTRVEPTPSIESAAPKAVAPSEMPPAPHHLPQKEEELERPSPKKVPCARCGTPTRAFKQGPVYCKRCMREIKKGQRQELPTVTRGEPVQIQPTEKAISLEDALKRKPVTFKGVRPAPGGGKKESKQEEIMAKARLRQGSGGQARPRQGSVREDGSADQERFSGKPRIIGQHQPAPVKPGQVVKL